jgi:hypothetical protein
MTESERMRMWARIWEYAHQHPFGDIRLAELIKDAIARDPNVPRVSATYILNGTPTIACSKID